MKKTLTLLSIGFLLTLTNCKKADDCPEGTWPDGYACYEIKGGEEETYCLTPGVRLFPNYSGSPVKPDHEFRFTPERGVADIYVRDFDDDFFAAGEVIEGTGEEARTLGGVIEVRMNQQSDEAGNVYVNRGEWARMEFTSVDLTLEVLSGTLEYSYLDNRPSAGGAVRTFRVEFDNYNF
jgi:hypothetical protein